MRFPLVPLGEDLRETRMAARQRQILRRLYIVSSEFRPFARKTGLSDLCAVAKQMPSGREVTLIMPRYEGGPEAQEQDLRYVRMPLRGFHVRVNQSGRVRGTIPCRTELWERFSEQVVSFIEEDTGGSGSFDVLAVDWPTGAAVRRLKGMGLPREGRVAFTLDLVPPEEPAYRLWWDGIEHADVLHLPTERWWRRIRRAERNPNRPGQLLSSHEAKVRFARLGIDPDMYDPSRAEGRFADCTYGREDTAEEIRAGKRRAKQEVQKIRGLEGNPEAMLLITAGRWSADDQKNFVGMLPVVEEILDRQHPVQFHVRLVALPEDERDSYLVHAYQRLAERWSNRLVVPMTPKSFSKLPWADLLRAADAQLVPSRYEPCGLNHVQGMVFGVVPICSSAVSEGDDVLVSEDDRSPGRGNSFLFQWDDNFPLASGQRMVDALRKAISIYSEQPGRWAQIRANTMRDAQKYTWGYLARAYQDLFR